MVNKVQVQDALEHYMESHEGLFLVDLRIDSRQCVVVVDHDTQPLDLQTCAEITRYLQDHFGSDLDDLDLEVSSAGLTSPLVMPRQYRKYLGKQLEVLLKKRVKLRGALADVSDEGFSLSLDKMVKPEGAKRKVKVSEVESFRYEDVKKAVYIIDF